MTTEDEMAEGLNGKSGADQAQDIFVPAPNEVQRDLSALTEKLNHLRDSL